MMQELMPGVFRWEEKPIFMPRSGLWIEGPQGAVAIDPPRSPETGWAIFDERQPLAAIVLTSSHHERESALFSERYDAPILAPWDAVEELSLTPDFLYEVGDALPGGLHSIAVPAAEVAENALYLPRRGGLMVVGDLLLNYPLSGLSPLSRGCGGPRTFRQLEEELAPLLQLDFEALFCAHGDPILHGAKEAILRMLEGARQRSLEPALN